MASGGALALNEFVRKTQLCIMFFHYLFIKSCHSSNLSQNKFMVTYWDLRVYNSITLEIGFTVT